MEGVHSENGEPMTLGEALSWGQKRLEDAGVPEASLDAWHLLEHVCQIDRGSYFLHCHEEFSREKLREYGSLVEKRASRIPLQYITGTQCFMGLDFVVNPDVLIPRQDTETLVEAALGVLRPGMRVLDLCTGSGCILISLLHFVERAIGTGSDISERALAVARENAKIHGVSASWVQSDLFSGIEGTFDMIVSNPPYIPTAVIDGLQPEVREFEPHGALDGHGDGLFFYREIMAGSGAHLASGGHLVVEIGHDEGQAVVSLMKQAGYGKVEVIRDLGGLDRVVCGRKG